MSPKAPYTLHKKLSVPGSTNVAKRYGKLPDSKPARPSSDVDLRGNGSHRLDCETVWDQEMISPRVAVQESGI